MASFTRSDDLRGAVFTEVDLTGARFDGADLRGAVLRGVDLAGAEIDSPWLLSDDGVLLVSGVDVVPFVRAELERRFPGRSQKRATDPAGLREAWAAVEHAWSSTLARVAAMPAGSADASVAGEWSFAQTLRHLVMATDLWLGRAVLGAERPFHPLGLACAGAEEDGLDMSPFSTETPTYDDVLEARAGRVAMVRDFLATVTPDDLTVPRRNPWSGAEVTTLSCLHVILNEEWEHLRFALRDLDALAAEAS